MKITQPHPDLKHLVLLGGGHAQVAVLKALMMNPLPGLRTTLISRDILTPYSGMLPGYLEGLYSEKDITIDLSHLARRAKARFINGTVDHLDANRKKLKIQGYPELGYDLLSVNIGSSPDLAPIKGAKDHAIPVKPISQLLARIAPLFDEKAAQELGGDIAIIGGGAAGVEMALSLHHRLVVQKGRSVRITIIQRGTRILPEFPTRAAMLLSHHLKSKSIEVVSGKAVVEINKKVLILDDGTHLQADYTFVVTAGRPAAFLTKSGLELDAEGFIAVAPTLQSVSHSDVFASGDIASVVSAPRPKAGVFAVRAGAILTQNLRRAVLNKPLKAWRPQKRYLALLGTGNRQSMAMRGGVVLKPSRFLWHLKEWIDRQFISKFSQLPEMPAPPPTALAKSMQAHLNAKGEHEGDAALASMRCLGCGAKTGFSDLEAGLAAAEAFLRSQSHDLGYDLPQSINVMGDSARVLLSDSGMPPDATSRGEATLVQSVDVISAIVDDPFMLGRIAALHALSDLIASHAKPHSALAIVTLAEAFSRLQKNDLTQILGGALQALQEHDTRLSGGHSSTGPAMQVGFAVFGLANKMPCYEPVDGDCLLLTKPLGIGAIMAAHAQGHRLATGLVRQKAIEVMATSNAIAGGILARFGQFPMTDITGFGLGRHGLSLASSVGDGLASLEIAFDSVPIMSPAVDLLRSGVSSSLHHANRSAVPMLSDAASLDLGRQILFDPQTGGGLLAIVPGVRADEVLGACVRGGVDASVIGRIVLDGEAILRVI